MPQRRDNLELAVAGAAIGACPIRFPFRVCGKKSKAFPMRKEEARERSSAGLHERLKFELLPISVVSGRASWYARRTRRGLRGSLFLGKTPKPRDGQNAKFPGLFITAEWWLTKSRFWRSDCHRGGRRDCACGAGSQPAYTMRRARNK